MYISCRTFDGNFTCNYISISSKYRLYCYFGDYPSTKASTLFVKFTRVGLKTFCRNGELVMGVSRGGGQGGGVVQGNSYLEQIYRVCVCQ